MADKIQYTDDELELIDDLVAPLTMESRESLFSPMKPQFDSDMRAINPVPEEPEPGLDDLLAETPEEPEPGLDDLLAETPEEPEPGLDDLLAETPEEPEPGLDDLLAETPEEPEPGLDDLLGETPEQPEMGLDDLLGGAPEQPEAGFDDLLGETPEQPEAGFDDLLGETPEQPDAGLDDLLGGTPEQPEAGFDDLLGETPEQPEAGFDDLLGETPEQPDAGLDDLLGGAPEQPEAGFDDLLGETPEQPETGLDDLLGGAPEQPEAGFDDLLGETPEQPDAGLDDLLGGAPEQPEAGLGEEMLEGADAGLEALLGGETTPSSAEEMPGLDDLSLESGGELDELAAPSAGIETFEPEQPEKPVEFLASDLTQEFENEPLPDMFAGEEEPLSLSDEGGLPDVHAAPVSLSDTGFDDLLGSHDLDEMSRQANLNQGIGDELSDEELAKIRNQILDYPPGLKKAIIDAIVNETISRPDQRLLMNMVIDQAKISSIADFLEARTGRRPAMAASTKRKDGVSIIYADGLSPDAMQRKRRNAILLVAFTGIILIGVGLFFGGYRYLDSLATKRLYEQGLDELRLARLASGVEKEKHKKAADDYYNRALSRDNGHLSIEYLNRYGIASMQAGLYGDAFIKLFGKVEPDYRWDDPEMRAPLLRLTAGSVWPDPEEWKKGVRPQIVAADKVVRRIVVPGAYITGRLRDGTMDKTTIMNLSRFHSLGANSFISGDAGKRYKNDKLAIDYYRLILTLLNMPDDIDAMAGIGDIYYKRREFVSAAREYNKILEKEPTAIQGHAGLISTYIEIWKKEGDPRFVIARHRLMQSMNIEDELPIYILTKLASFYTDLDPDTLRIKYQVDPVDVISKMDIEDNAVHLLELAFKKSEKRDDEVIDGSKYGEGFYQRGRFLMKKKEALRALKQFQNAYQYAPNHYLAVNAMGEYYMNLLDFDRAAEYFQRAVEIYEKNHDNYGIRPEDETLLEGDFGKILFNLGSLAYLRYAGYDESNPLSFRTTRIYPDRASNIESEELTRRREKLRVAREYFERSLDQGLQDPKAKIEAIYRIGWIDYVNGDFENALKTWENLDALYGSVYSDRSLLMAKANAYYYTGQPRSALGNLLKVMDDLEREALEIQNPTPENALHRELYQSLAAVYNNAGALYEKEAEMAGGNASLFQSLETKSLENYWKSVEASRKIGMDNEIARTNIQLAFKRDRNKQPLLNDWTSPVLSSSENQK